MVTTLYRSERFLPELHGRLVAAAETLTPRFEIILVNDGSPDGSLPGALALSARDARVRVVDLSRNFGHHRAMMTGLEHARGDLVFLIDADLEEDPALLPRFHQELTRRGVDVVYGVASRRTGGLTARLGGWLFYAAFNLLSRVPVVPNVSTVRLMTRRYVTALLRHREREVMIAGLWAATGFDQVAIPIDRRPRPDTSYSLGRRVSVLVNAITSFSARPLVLVFYLGLIICLLAGATAAYLVVRRLFFGVLLPGWPSVMVSVWLLGGLTLFAIGLVGIYLAKVFEEVKARPYTIVRQVYEGGRPVDAPDGAPGPGPRVPPAAN